MKKRINYENNDYYEGEIKGEKRNGKGKLKTKEFEYEGSFLDNEFEGDGKIVFNRGK
jgi:hypothetical protein